MKCIFIFSVFWLSLALAQRGHNRSWAYDRWKDFTTSRDTNSWIPYDWSWSNSFIPWAPTPMEWEKWATHYMSHIIANLTGELYKDVQIKRRQGDIVREKYEELPGFKLGYIAEGIGERYKKMTSIYANYSKYEYWSTLGKIYDMLGAYQMMQTEYNELILEKAMYLEILSQFYSARPTVSKNNTNKPEGIKEGMSIDNWKSLSVSEKYQLIEDERRKRFINSGRPVRRSLNKSRLASRMNGRRRAEVSHIEAQEEYKKRLRHVKWLEKWKGFNPENEGFENFPHLTKNSLMDNSFVGVNVFN